MEKIDGLAYRLNDNLIIQKVENYIQNLDNFFPCYDNLNFSDYSHHKNKKSPYIMPRRLPYAETISSRGCPNNCIFCSSNAINGRKIRARSADSILKEIDWLVKKYGIKELIFLDDNFHFNRKRVKEILAGLIKRSYDLEWKTTNSQISLWNDELLELVKESGCYQLSIAPECGSIEQLELIRKPSPKKTFLNAKPIVKKAKELGMNTIGSFIIGIPGETWDQIKQTSKYAEELDLDYCAFNIATPLPKTELYYNCKKNKLIPKEFGFNNLGFKGFGIPNITTNEFTPSELLMFRIMEWDRINFSSPEKIKRVAEVNGLTIDEIEEWRKDTRRGIEIKLK